MIKRGGKLKEALEQEQEEEQEKRMRVIQKLFYAVTHDESCHEEYTEGAVSIIACNTIYKKIELIYSNLAVEGVIFMSIFAVRKQK